jgi:glutamine amidotransferase
MGWNEVHQSEAHPMWTGIPDATRFYFVHSYFPQPARPELVAGYSHYPFPFCCAVAQGNLFAVQFHPEKSHRSGLRLLANFVNWDAEAGTVNSDLAEAGVATNAATAAPERSTCS